MHDDRDDVATNDPRLEAFLRAINRAIRRGEELLKAHGKRCRCSDCWHVGHAVYNLENMASIVESIMFPPEDPQGLHTCDCECCH